MPWTLEINGTQQTLEEWGVEGIVLRTQNSALDTLTFTRRLQQFDANPLCEHGDPIVLRWNADIWFRGDRAIVPAECTAPSELQSYRFDGPWRWLAENVFLQVWRGQFPTSHIILVGNIGVRIKAVLDHAISRGAGLQYQVADLNALTTLPPVAEFTGQLCSNVITECLQWMPDTVAWFDYSTAVPTLRFGQRPNLAAVSLPLAPATGPIVHAVNLAARPDLQVPSVAIVYERIDTEDDAQRLTVFTDRFPLASTGLEDGALNDVVVLQGRDTTTVQGEIECQTIQPTSLEWLKQHIHTLRDPRVTILSGPSSVERVDEDGNPIPVGDQLPRELIFGNIAEWMDLAYQYEIFRVKISYQTVEDVSVGAADQIKLDVKDEALFSFKIVTTDAPDGVSSYNAIASIDSEEATPVGLAEALYHSLSVLHYEGAFRLKEPDCTRLVRLGQVVNLTGSREEYATMRALVQAVTYSIDDGDTTIECGPPGHLSISDYLAILRANQRRRRWTNPNTQSTGELGNDGEVSLGQATPNDNTIPGASNTKLLVVKEGGAANAEKYIRLAIEDLDGLDPATQRAFFKKNLRVRLATVCVRNAQGIIEEKYAAVLMSETWPIA